MDVRLTVIISQGKPLTKPFMTEQDRVVGRGEAANFPGSRDTFLNRIVTQSDPSAQIRQLEGNLRGTKRDW